MDETRKASSGSFSDYDIEIFNLTKKYQIKNKKEVIALNNINLKVKKGEIFGLLGPNGAGKTTMVSILTTLIQPTSGYATILGHNILKEPWFIKENVGLMFGGEMIYYRLSGYRNLKFFSKIYGIKDYKSKIDELAELFNLIPWMNQMVSTYSKGMKLKLALARVLLINPKVLFLDEPLLGLDPKSVREVIKILVDLKKTIFLTSHQMNVIQELCERIAFLKQGEILKVDYKEKFLQLIKKKIKVELKVANKTNELIQTLKNHDFIYDIRIKRETIFFTIKDDTYFPKLFNILKNYPITHFNEKRPDLEELFITLSK
ncbi:MAG: ATP-binding cassette domain-containing protein [Candidatus Odinarchaeota archaeon]